MSASADGGQPVVTVRQFRLHGGHDTDNSDSDEGKGGAVSRLRGGASAAATAGARPTDAPQTTSLPTAAAATPASLPPRAGSSSSLELFTSPSSRSSSPACSELPSGFMTSTAAAAATPAPKDLWGGKLSGSSCNNGRVSDTYQRGHRIGSHERGDGDTAQTRQQLRGAGSPVGALMTSARMRLAVEEERQTVPGKALVGDAAVVVEVPSMPSPTASASPALRTSAVQPRSAVAGFFEGKEASAPTAIEGVAFATFSTSLSAGSAGGMSRPAASATATAVPSSPAPPTATGMGTIRTDVVPTVEAAVASVYTGGPSGVVQESSQTSVGSVASPTGVRKAPLVARSSSSSLDGDPAPLAPVQVASPTSTGLPSGGAATATRGLSIRKLTVPFTTAAEVDTSPSSSSPRQPLPSTTRPSTAAAASAGAGRTAIPAAASTAPSSAFTAVPDGRSSALGSGSPVLSGPGSVVYNRVSAKGCGSVPSSVLEVSSRPKWCAPPGEHTASPSPPAAAAQSAAISAAPPPLPGPVVSTQAAHAAEPTPAAARTSAFSTSQAFLNLLTRPHRQAPRLPGATHTSAALSLIEDDGRPRCSSPPVSSVPSTEGDRAETGQPKTARAQGRGPPSSLIVSLPSPPTQHAASSAEGATSLLLSQSAAVTAAQRQREAAVVIYDDRVPPAQRRAKRQARPMTGQTAAIAPTDSMSACVLRGLRTDAPRDGNREDPLTCRPILRIGGGGGAGWRRNPVDWFSERPPLDGSAVEDDGCEGVDGSDNATRGRLDHSTALYGFSGIPTGCDQYPGRSSSEDRSAKLTMRSASKYTVQRLFSEPQPQHKARVDSYISATGNGESVPCVVMRLGQRGAQTASDVTATHGDVSSAGLSSAKLSPAAASTRTAVSLLTDESVNVDLLNYRCSRRKQQQQR